MNCLKAGLAAIALAGSVLIPAGGSAAVQGESYIVYVGGYTLVSGKGVYAYRFTPTTGAIAPLGLIEPAANPSWLADEPTHRFLYAVNEHPAKDAPDSGNSVTAYARDERTGRLTALNRVSSMGTGPEQLAVGAAGRILAVANFGAGDLATYRILPDGRLSEAVSVVTEKADGKPAAGGPGPILTDSHLEGVEISPDGRFVLTCNIGLATVTAYRLNADTGALQPAGRSLSAPGPAGKRWRPRHLVFDPSGRFVYIVDSSMQVTTATFDPASGALKVLQSAPIETSYPTGQAMSATEIRLDRAGRYLYTSSRPVDATMKSAHMDGVINVFAVDPGSHTLKPVQHVSSGGDSPRSFALAPSGDYLFVGNQYSGSIEILAVDRLTGMLSPTGKRLMDAPEPSAFVFESAR